MRSMEIVMKKIMRMRITTTMKKMERVMKWIMRRIIMMNIVMMLLARRVIWRIALPVISEIRHL